VEEKRSELTFEDRLVLLDQFRKIVEILHHARGEETKIKVQIFIAILKRFAEKYPEKRQALIDIFGDFEKGDLSELGWRIYEDLKNIRNFCHRGPFFEKYFMKLEADKRRKFTRYIDNSLRNLRNFRKFIEENKNLLEGLKDFI